MVIRRYEDKDELEWVRCRVLAVLDSAYFDNVLREKEKYENKSIELVAEVDGKIVGLIDVEYEAEKGNICSIDSKLGAVINHLAVLPEYRRQGISTALLNHAKEYLIKEGIEKVEAWTRDDKWVCDWYDGRGFKVVDEFSYLHLYTKGAECDILCDPKLEKITVMETFTHYVGDNKEEMKKKFDRVHECRMYELVF